LRDFPKTILKERQPQVIALFLILIRDKLKPCLPAVGIINGLNMG